MTVLEYYLSNQENSSWYDKFQKIGNKNCGKLFSYSGTNFRSLKSFFSQLQAFEQKDGLKRSEWNDFQITGQEKDKHRIKNLKNAGFIEVSDGAFCFTEKGYEALRIHKSNELTSREKWIMLLILISDYKTEKRELDIIKTVIELVETLNTHKIAINDFMHILSDNKDVLDKEKLFCTDAFWLITFYKDPDFLDLYINSTPSEKDSLYKRVISCSRDRNSTDLIAHKFVSGGIYSPSTFNDDINVTLSIMIIMALADNSWRAYLKIMNMMYPDNTDIDRMAQFMSHNSEIYSTVYDKTFNYINKILNNR